MFSGVKGWCGGRDERRGGGKEKGRVLVSDVKPDLIGEGGEYISDSWDNSVGRVSAEKRWRMLSHWVWVVCKQE